MSEWINRDWLINELRIAKNCKDCPRFEPLDPKIYISDRVIRYVSIDGFGECKGHLTWLCNRIRNAPERRLE